MSGANLLPTSFWQMVWIVLECASGMERKHFPTFMSKTSKHLADVPHKTMSVERDKKETQANFQDTFSVPHVWSWISPWKCLLFFFRFECSKDTRMEAVHCRKGSYLLSLRSFKALHQLVLVVAQVPNKQTTKLHKSWRPLLSTKTEFATVKRMSHLLMSDLAVSKWYL